MNDPVYLSLSLLPETNVCNIIQVSAICGEHIFNGYTVPARPIPPKVTELTGFTVNGSCLYHHGLPVQTLPLRDLLTDFINYLRRFPRPLLVAHNAVNFDAPVLMRVLAENGLQQSFTQEVSRFMDTYLLSRYIYPKLKKYSLEFLASHFLHQQFDAHNGLEDATILQKLFNTWKPAEPLIDMFTSSTAYFKK